MFVSPRFDIASFAVVSSVTGAKTPERRHGTREGNAPAPHGGSATARGLAPTNRQRDNALEGHDVVRSLSIPLSGGILLLMPFERVPRSIAIVRSSDGFDVPWRCPTEAKTISLRKAQLEAMQSRTAIVRILAHGGLLDFQIAKLFGSVSSRKRAMRLRSAAVRIVRHDLAELCAGVGETRVLVALQGPDDVDAFRQRLAELPFDEWTARLDLAALEAWLERERPAWEATRGVGAEP